VKFLTINLSSFVHKIMWLVEISKDLAVFGL